MKFHLATRPYGVIDAINRMALATGGVRNAMIGSNADYNGHHVEVRYNWYRGYWTAHYMWAGPVRLATGATLERALRAAQAEYDRGALGASAVAEYPDLTHKTEKDRAPDESYRDFHRICTAVGFTREDRLPPETWRTPLHELVNEALEWERHGMAPAVGFLANSKTVEEYRAKVEAHCAEQRAARRGVVVL